MVWKVRADCTYTTTANKTSRQSAVEALISSHPAGYPTPITVGRFPGGVISQSTTRFTVAYDFPTQATAIAFKNAVATAVQAATRSSTLISIHEAD